MGELYGQLAGISAVLAGFAITFLALLLGHKEHSRCLAFSIAVTIAAAANLLVSALGWSLMSSLLTQVGAQQGTAVLQDPEFYWVAGGHRMLSFTFVSGLLFLFSMLGLSGWLRSRALGIFSTASAVAAALTVWRILRHVIN
ncbi:hypothetical protein KAW64_10875 [bacterium]|nr:hypothetical protein [bacterium]